VANDRQEEEEKKEMKVEISRDDEFYYLKTALGDRFEATMKE
jgi:hypothetical protein